jgi:hypothetical protein
MLVTRKKQVVIKDNGADISIDEPVITLELSLRAAAKNSVR